MPQQLLIIAIDTVNTPILLQSWARNQTIKYLQANPPKQPVAIVAITPDGLREVHEFTADTATLVESLKQMRINFSRHDSQEALIPHIDSSGRIETYASYVNALTERQADEVGRNFNAGLITLQAFEQLAWAYSGVPGSKTVLWLTSGFPIVQEVPTGPAMIGHGAGHTGNVPFSTGRQLNGELLPEFQRAFTSLNKSNVIVYPMDVRGLPMDNMWDPSQPAALFVHPELSHLSPALPDTDAADTDGMKELSRRTGGKTCTTGNTVKSCMDQALAESNDYYLLGFYVSQQSRKAGWHKLKVTVNADHGEVRARSSYFLRAKGAPLQQEQEEDLRSAIHAGVEYTGIVFSVERGVRKASSTDPVFFKISVPSTSILLLPGQEKLSFDVMSIPLSSKGVPVSGKSRVVKLEMTPETAQKALTKGWNLIDSVDPKDPVSAVKVVIRDNNTGRIGSVVFPLMPAPEGG